MRTMIFVIGTLLSLAAGSRQSAIPPRDGEIRVAYWELLKETTISLTLEPKAITSKSAPSGMTLTLTRRFPGKHPAVPPTHVEVLAHAGLLWAPRNELSFVLDGIHTFDVGSTAIVTNATEQEFVLTGLQSTISTPILQQMAAATRVTGNALGFQFELTESQRRALQTFVEQVLSETPTETQRCWGDCERRSAPTSDGPGG
jgi:hypothetical protein